MLLAGILAAALIQAAQPTNRGTGAPGVENRGTEKKVEIVSVTGCLREPQSGIWMLTAATDPVPSSANAPAVKDIPTSSAAGAPVGKNEFRLIGVSEFNLPAHRGHTVIVKGLHIKANPVSRLNVTSVTMVTASCAAEK